MNHLPIPLKPCLATSCLIFLLAACSSLNTNTTTASSEGTLNKYYSLQGQGTPTIVLQAGLGDDKSAWNPVIHDLARYHQVIALDRPGHANHPATDAPRDPCTIAAEQRAMLQATGVTPPYLVIGHSLGGTYEFVYAKLYPQDVAGFVLLDPTPLHHWENMQRAAPQAATLLKVLRTVAFSRTDKAEFDEQSNCLERLDLSKPLTQPGKVLVSARRRPEEKGDFETMLNRTRQQWVGLTGVSKLNVIQDSGHYIQKDSPEDVLQAVQEVTDKIKGK